jgi:hypothetical protein
MSKSTPTPLTMPAIPKKGDAAPAIHSIQMSSSVPQSVTPASFPASSGPAPLPPAPLRLSSRVRATIAVTLRLDQERYERLKNYGASRRLTNQEILIAALDRFMTDPP